MYTGYSKGPRLCQIALSDTPRQQTNPECKNTCLLSVALYPGRASNAASGWHMPRFWAAVSAMSDSESCSCAVLGGHSEVQA